MEDIRLYTLSCEVTQLVDVFVSLGICAVGWIMLWKVSTRNLRPYARWLTLAVTANTFTTGAVLVNTFITFFNHRDYLLAAAANVLELAALLFYVLAFVRLWKLIGGLTPGRGRQAPVLDRQSQDGVWPPPPSTSVWKRLGR